MRVHRRESAKARAGRVLALALLLPTALSCTTEGRTAPGGGESGPRQGGVLRLLHEAPDGLDPITAASVYEALPINQIFDGLLDFDPALSAVPGLASTWTISKDAREYTFHLRPGVLFHDGTTLTADDVVFTFRRAMAPENCAVNLACPYLEAIEGAPAYIAGETGELPGVEAVDDLTVRIRLGRPYLSFLQVLAMDNMKIVPRGALERMGEEAFARSPVGTGPFRMGSWDETGMRLVANPDHYDGPPFLRAVEILRPREDENDLGVARFRSGEIDLVSIPTEEIGAFSRDPSVRIYRYHELSVSFLGLSCAHPPLDDVRVRRAVAHALDRNALAAQSPQTRRMATGILPPGLPGYSPQPKALGHDRERALELLVEAGHPGGDGLPPIRLYTTAGTSAALERLLDRLRADLSAVGLELELHAVTWPELNRAIEERSAPAFLLGWIADLPDPDSFLRSPFETGGVANYFSFGDAEIDGFLDHGALEQNAVVRAKLYRDIERRILDQAPIVPLYNTVEVLAVRNGVRGLEPTPMGMANVDLSHVGFTAPAETP